jgi:hypothetical protein
MTSVERALGSDRVAKLRRVTAELLAFADSVPSTTEAAAHLAVPLRANSTEGATEELTRRIEAFDPGGEWALGTFRTADGRRVGKASPFLPAILPGSTDWFIQFSLADLYSRLAAWFLTQVWRAGELASAARDSIERWQLLVAAAAARSLLEGAAAFTVEADSTITEWSNFKQAGEPTLDRLGQFTASFNRRITELQYASRIGQGTDRPPVIASKNVLTYISKLARAHGEHDIDDIYQWLCDAVHPSFGSWTTFTVTRGKHGTGTHIREVYARSTLAQLADSGFALTPTVAHKAADAVIASSQVLLPGLHRMQWLVHDLGFTSGTAFVLKLDAYGRRPRPQRNDRCPCGSGKKFKACSHRWGVAGMPPDRIGGSAV